MEGKNNHGRLTLSQINISSNAAKFASLSKENVKYQIFSFDHSPDLSSLSISRLILLLVIFTPFELIDRYDLCPF